MKRCTPQERAIQRSIADAAQDLRGIQSQLRALYRCTERLPSYRECLAKWDAGNEEEITVGWDIAGALATVADDLEACIKSLRDVSRTTPEKAAAMAREINARFGRTETPTP